MNTENNILIAEFMGVLQHGNLVVLNNVPIHIDNSKYYSDWNWLMEVVEKIEGLNDGGFDVDIFTDGTVITQYRENETADLNEGLEIIRMTRAEMSFETKIEFVYNACIEFIKHYNEQQKH